ncbi:MAG TPA: 3-phosphoshikimate 1-carboxyvinyltransferase [Acidimicrobiia bacterium]|nr:3-phosphoshikimate 1-carboxyvinyltransferase [Acidimicrobiia bacterium]
MTRSSSAIYQVQPVHGRLDAVVRVPGSKSIANRALVCATLADGMSVLRNMPGGDDTAAMSECVAWLGAGVSADPHDPTTVSVYGTSGALRPGPITLHARLAGTTSRFITALCALGTGHYEIDGLPPLRERPMGPLHDALSALGATVEPGERPGHLPVTVHGIGVEARSGTVVKSPTRVSVRGDSSSQYLTALMLIGPYLPGGLRIDLTTKLVSRPYVAITSAVMARFGVAGVTISEAAVVVPRGYYRAQDHAIEPDASSASYPLAAAAICGGRVTVADLGPGALQGDAAFADVLASMGCAVEREASGTTVARGTELSGITIDMSDLSDLVPSLAAVAPFAASPTEISGVGFIRTKESDRIAMLARELRKCGVEIAELDDGLRIAPGVGHGAALETHHDHRLAMAFAVMGLALPGVRVHDPDVVMKSWPDFWTVLEGLRPTT